MLSVFGNVVGSMYCPTLTVSLTEPVLSPFSVLSADNFLLVESDRLLVDCMCFDSTSYLVGIPPVLTIVSVILCL